MVTAMIGQADFSPCGVYRYTLRRQWLIGEGTVLWVMLNPSTADASQDDPTIRRCIGFSKAWGYQGLTVANIFALRSTDPKKLLAIDDPIGPDNDTWLERLVSKGHDRVVAAWGARGGERGLQVAELLSRHADVHCLGITKGGQPRHPLYLSKDALCWGWRVTS